MKDCQIEKWKGCCCICRYQEMIYSHPWNKEPLKGSIGDRLGYGCTVFLAMREAEEASEKAGIIFSDRPHGMCEMFQMKDKES